MAGRVYVANAFSPSMLPLSISGQAVVVFERISPEEFRAGVRAALGSGGVACAIGYPGTARLAEELVGASLGCQRIQVTLSPGDTLYIVTLAFRPPEGRVYSYEELVGLAREGRIAFYRVRACL